MRYLLVIDDHLVRQKAYSQAEKIIKKMDRLEDDVESFRARDQRLFSSWYELTFRNEQKQIKDRQDEYQKLTHFHNWIIAVAKMKDISMADAIIFLREEQELYQSGTSSERMQIERSRQKRDEYIRRQVDKQFEDEFGEDSQFGPQDESEVSKEDRAELDEIREMEDEELRVVCEDKAAAFNILAMILNCAYTKKDYLLFLRVWNFLPRKYQYGFERLFEEKTEKSFEDFMRNMKERLFEDVDEEQEPEDDSETNEKFIDPDASLGRFARKQNGEQLEAIKLLYRKLVRHLHPDLQMQASNEWQKKMWDRVQSANRRQDRTELEKLFRLVLIRSQSLNDLTVSEIIESQKWLKEELDQLTRETRGLKKLPSWGFSRRKDYKALKRKVEKPLAETLRGLDHVLSELKRQHATLERIGRENSDLVRPRRRRRS